MIDLRRKFIIFSIENSNLNQSLKKIFTNIIDNMSNEDIDRLYEESLKEEEIKRRHFSDMGY